MRSTLACATAVLSVTVKICKPWTVENWYFDSTAGSGVGGDELSSEVDLQGLDSHHAEYSHQGKGKVLAKSKDDLNREDKEGAKR